MLNRRGFYKDFVKYGKLTTAYISHTCQILQNLTVKNVNLSILEIYTL